MKIENATKRFRRVFPTALLALLTFGCRGPDGALDDPMGPEPEAASSSPVLLREVLTAAMQDEYKAQATYQRVLADLGDILPFRNIVLAEGQHAGEIAGLFEARAWDVPADDWDITKVPGFASSGAACGAAVVAEEENIKLYDDFLTLGLPDDVVGVFERLRAASLERHLPAFTNCAE